MKTRLLLAALLCSLPALAGPALVPGADIAPFPGTTRDYAATEKGAFAKESFEAMVTVTLKSGQGGYGCAFLGLGKGKPNPQGFGEPTAAPSLCFRLAPNDFNAGHVTAMVNGQPAEETPIGDGTHRLRFVWDAAGKRAWLQIHRHWKPGAAFTPTNAIFLSDVSAAFGDDTKLFAGGSGGVRFADLSVKSLTAEDLAKFPVFDSFPKDATARTWLPVKGLSSEFVGPIGGYPTHLEDGFLRDFQVRCRPVVCFYKGPTLEASREPRIVDGTLVLPHSKWTLSSSCTGVAGQPDAHDLTFFLSLKEGSARESGLAVALDFLDWNTENYVLIPASVYNGNRNRIVPRGYAEGLDPKDYYRKDLPLSHASVPCLSKEADQPSKLEVNASNATTPAVCIFDKKAKRGFILLAEQAGRDAKRNFLRKESGEIMDNAFAVEESADRTRATVVVGAPGVREKKPAFIGFTGSPDRGMAMQAGDKIELRLRLYDFPADGIPALYEKFAAVRKSLTGPTQPRLLLPESEMERRMVAFTDSRFLDTPSAGFYMPENGDWIAFGWIGGWMNTFPMLAAGDEARLARVTRTFDFGLKAQEPSGWFHYSIQQDGNTASREPKPDMNLSRTNGDVLYWMIKQFDLLKAQGRGAAVKTEWEISMRKLADAAVKTWKRDGQWGKMINVKTGEVSEYNSSGGVMLIGGLALASKYFHNPEYLAVSKEAADYYYQRDFVKQGQITGACADILQNADSEVAFGFTAALMALYDVTGEKEWLEKSRNLANLASSWIVSYEYELPKFTPLGAMGSKFAGTFWASTQNKHGAPGICTSSGDSLVKLFRATGDVRYAELMRDIRHAHADAIYGGGGSERYTYCDADSRGDNPPGTNGWVATNGAMMSLEIPGIYLQTDTDRFYVFDSVEAKVVSRKENSVTVEVKNPTKFDAEVSVFAETAAQAAKPAGTTGFLTWFKVAVKAGKTATFTVIHDETQGTTGIFQGQVAPPAKAVP